MEYQSISEQAAHNARVGQQPVDRAHRPPFHSPAHLQKLPFFALLSLQHDFLHLPVQMAVGTVLPPHLAPAPPLST